MNSSLPAASDKGRTWFVLGAMTVGILVLIIDSLLKEGWITAAWWGYGLSTVFLLYAIIRRDQLLLRFFVFALTAGFAELLADRWLVDYTQTLVYPHPEPMLLSSPAYMPFSWAVVLMEVGYIGWLITNRWNLMVATIALCILGSILVPLYETWAIDAGWWYYHNTPVLGLVPKYVILAEGLLMLTIPFLLKKTETARLPMIVLFGLIEGAVMFLVCIIAYHIFQ
jgi:hypothetical protein